MRRTGPNKNERVDGGGGLTLPGEVADREVVGQIVHPLLVISEHPTYLETFLQIRSTPVLPLGPTRRHPDPSFGPPTLGDG